MLAQYYDLSTEKIANVKFHGDFASVNHNNQ